MDQNGSQTTYLLREELKRLIKLRKLNYKSLAQMLDLSESGFKKFINGKDFSFSKIERLCGVLNIKMSDLVNSIESKSLFEFEFEPKQESFFLAQRTAFLLFWLLVYERRSLKECQQVLDLEDKKVWSLLRQMDKIELLKVLPGDKLIIPSPQSIRWVGKSKFVKQTFLDWGRSLCTDVINAVINSKTNSPPNLYFNIRNLRMRESTWNEFKVALEHLEINFVNRATMEMRFGSDDLRHVRWLSAVDNLSWADQELGIKPTEK